MIDYFERKIRLKDLEVWDVRIGKQEYLLVIEDEFRPAKFEDFEIPDLIYEEDDQRENLVSAKYFSNESIRDEHKPVLAKFVGQLTNHLAMAHCEVIIKMKQENLDKAIKRIMLSKYGVKELDIPLEKLWHFNQD